MLKKICRQKDVEIIKVDMSQDHIHLFVSMPPQVTGSRFVQRLKGKTSHKLLSEYPHLQKTCWSSGNVTDEVIKQYIEGYAINQLS